MLCYSVLNSNDTESGDTSPSAAVEFDAHANCSRVAAVRYNAQSSCDDRRIDLPDLGDVRVTVAAEDLHNAPVRYKPVSV